MVLFFVLSGTVLSLSLDRKGRGAGILAAFYIKRMFRLAPLLVTVTLAAAMLHYVYFDGASITPGTSWMNSYLKHEPTLREVATNAVGWRNTLNSPTWTIFIEIWASILFPLLYVFTAGSVGTVLMLLVVLVALFTPSVLRDVDTFLACFYVGALIPRYGDIIARRFFALGKLSQTFIVVLVIATAGLFERFYSPTVFIDPVTIFVTTICAALIVTLIYHDPQGRILAKPSLMVLGEISYGLYLVHFLVLFVIAHAVSPAFYRPLEPVEALITNLALGVLTLLISIPIAMLTYVLIERPFQNLGRSLAVQIESRTT